MKQSLIDLHKDLFICIRNVQCGIDTVSRLAAEYHDLVIKETTEKRVAKKGKTK